MAADPYRYFRVEARELVEGLGQGVLGLERSAPPDLIPRLLRLAHTLKGAARVVKQAEIADLSHGIEDTLAALRAAEGPAPRSLIDEVLAKLDAIAERVKRLDPASREAETAPGPDQPALRGETLYDAGDAQDLEILLKGLTEAQVELEELRRIASTVGRARHSADLLSGQISSPRPTGPRDGGDGGAGLGWARMRPLAQDLGAQLAAAELQLAAGLDGLDRELGEVRDVAERLRLVSVGSVFTALERTARDAAASLGRRVRFSGLGGEVRLDAQVLRNVQGALLQMVRNAVAHGIEPEAERRRAGKPPEGRVALEVVRRGNRVSFVCRDDGRGVDLEAVRQVAQRKGLLAGVREPLDGEGLLRLLLAGGGISTSGTVTEIAGRGIGLDVVREAAAALGGDVQAGTRAGQGTWIELAVPVSVSSLPALLVEVEDVTAAIPLDAVRQTLRIAPSEMAIGAHGASLPFGGAMIPFVPLARPLGRRLAPAAFQRSWSAVVVGTSALAAIGVDRLVGTEWVVLRPLPRLASASAVVAGAALDSAGKPRLVLDPEALAAAAGRIGEDIAAAPPAPPPILIVDDSLTTRMLEASILESAGYEVDLATSAEEALEKAKERAYSLFLVDVEMPGMDGFELLERFGADPRLRSTPAILVTSRNDPEDRQRGVEVGAAGYVVKSEFDQTDLLARIRRLVE